jgi:hypothetical protein
MDINKAVIDYRASNREATFQDAIKYAKATFGDSDEMKEFLTTWADCDAKARKFASDVGRIWPSDKGY